MLSKRILQNLRFLNKSIFNSNKKFFSVNTTSLKSVLKEEISSEEKNYSPVDQKELTQFYQSTKFEFSENESTRMELKKNENGTQVVVTFFSKPPMPQQEQDPNNEEEQGKNNLLNIKLK